jgi:hypothetical protein
MTGSSEGTAQAYSVEADSVISLAGNDGSSEGMALSRGFPRARRARPGHRVLPLDVAERELELELELERL